MNKERIIEWLKLYKKRIITIAVITIILTVAFFAGEKPDGRGSQADSDIKAEQNSTKDKKISEQIIKNNKETASSNDQSLINEETIGDNGDSDSHNETREGNVTGDNHTGESSTTDGNGSAVGGSVQEDNRNTGSSGEKGGAPGDASSAGNETISEAENSNNSNVSGNTDSTGNSNISGSTGNKPDEIKPKKPTCTISISCATILNNMDKLDKNKKDLVPKDGWILKPITVEYEENETVFDLLKRICMERKIHMESSWTPMYNSAYIEGIYNLYEFDCGSLSGWMYSVNGVYNNYGCSKAVIKEGDVIKWVYTCDLGKDI